jgi:Mn2+/Fe2+ NRAMP family transporter
MRERFGFRFFLLLLAAVTCVGVLTLGAEVGGMCLALQLASGVSAP